MASSSSSSRCFDEIRRTWVAATPEEHVRQRILKKMIYALGFPKELIVVEKELKELPHLSAHDLPQRRIDILCYGKEIHPEHPLYPLLLIECKKDVLDEKAAQQLIGYNAHVRAYFIALAGPEEEKFGFLDKKTKQYIFNRGFPLYKDLMSWLKR
jgi:Type I restriction enzyme R protein N terminus (HSDR_N)